MLSGVNGGKMMQATAQWIGITLLATGLIGVYWMLMNALHALMALK
jgi:hypothetical protein